MDHEQVRSWILDGETEDADISRLAAEHLAHCDACQAFSEQWSGAKLALEARPVVAPQAGFRERWFERLVLARHRRHRRQTALALSVCAIGSLSTFAVMVWWVLEAPARAFGIILSQLAVVDVQIQLILDSIRIVALILPPLANLGLVWAGVALASGLIMVYLGFSALWTASFYRAVLQPRNKEI